MSTVSGPYGLRPIGRLGSQPFAGGVRTYSLGSNSATGFFTGDLISMGSGVPAVATATPTTTRSANTPIGVFLGCSYVNSSSQLVYAPYLPANAITNGATSVTIQVLEDPFAVFQVQADGAVATTKIGLNAPLGNFSAGNTTFGTSGVNLTSASIANTATLAVRIIDVPTLAGVSTPGDAFTDCYVVFNFGVHAYLNSTGA